MEYREDYSGVLTALPYAFVNARSRLFRAYVVAAVLVTAFVALAIATGLVRLVAATAAGPGSTLTLSRTFYVVIAILVVLPTLAPVLFVAHRHRREGATRPRYEFEAAASGLAFVLSVYVLLAATTPPDLQTANGTLAGLYDVPVAAAVVLVLASTALVYLVGRYR